MNAIEFIVKYAQIAPLKETKLVKYAQLTRGMRRDIRAARAKGVTYKDIMSEFNVSFHTASRVIDKD